MKRSLIDTDVLSEFLRGNTKVVEQVEEYIEEHRVISISVITYYEVLNGLLYKDTRKFLDRFREFAALNQVIPLTTATADAAASIEADLRKKGLGIGHTDTLIAGTAITSGLQLVTNNTDHFKRIKGLTLANWTK